MKRRYTTLIGNTFMATGIILMVGGILVSIFSYLPELGLSMLFSQGGLGGLFLGAFIWLIGAHLCGRERIEDRYWCIRRAARMKQHKHS